jgi:uncharacterized protein (TIGR03435 family)
MINRSVSLAAFAALIAAGLSAAQVEGKAPAFEVAAIRPSDPAARNNGCFLKGQPGGQTFVGRCVTLRLMITYSYKIIDSQLVGGPGWMNTELFDFEAKADHSLTREELAPLFQTMLAERFKLQFHKETRTLPALAVTVDKAGVKMKPNDGPNGWEYAVMPVPGGPPPKFKGTRCPMSYLTWWIAQRENRPVVDNTGLTGYWDFTLEYVADKLTEARKGPGGEVIPAVDGPTLYTALREQLGLKMESVKAPVEVYAVDKAERPAGN